MHHETSTHELTGGAKLLLINVPNAPTLYFGSYIRSGVRFVDHGKHELSHLLEHLAFEGNELFAEPLDFKAEVERNGAFFNAYTDADINWYEIVSGNDPIERLIPLVIAQLYRPLFAPKRIQQQQATITNELKGYKENDGWRAMHYTNKLLLPQMNPEIDDRIVMMEKVTRDDLLKFHKAHYGASNTFFVVAGDFSSAAAGKLVKAFNQHLGGVPEGKLREFPLFKHADFGGKIMTYEPYRKSQSNFLLRFTRPGYDMQALPALSLLSTMYTSGMSSRMNMKAREAGLTYGINSGAYLGIDDTGFVVVSETAIEKLNPLISMSMKELAGMVRGEYSDDEMARAKSYDLGRRRRSNQTPAGIAGWYANDFAHGQPLMDINDWNQRMQSVTRKDIERVAGKYLQNNNLTLVVVGAGLKSSLGHYEKMVGNYFPVKTN